jgi:hypothetical protein
MDRADSQVLRGVTSENSAIGTIAIFGPLAGWYRANLGCCCLLPPTCYSKLFSLLPNSVGFLIRIGSFAFITPPVPAATCYVPEPVPSSIRRTPEPESVRESQT